MSTFDKALLCCMVFLGCGLLKQAGAAPIVFAGPAFLAGRALNDFTDALPSTQIGWDEIDVRGNDSDPATLLVVPGTVLIPVDRFRNEGIIFEAPYAVSGNGFSGANPETVGRFRPFSPNNTLAVADLTLGEFNDHFIDLTFIVPGTDIPGSTRGFGAIFVDAETPGSTIEFFGMTLKGEPVSLGQFMVPSDGQAGNPEFLGVVFDTPIVTHVRLTVGDNALFSFNGTQLQGFGEEGGFEVDLVVNDDFVFGVPVERQLVTEPGPVLLLATMLALLSLYKRRAGP
jgi:hypothetical protein